jgi:homoserine dehydrogenase
MNGTTNYVLTQMEATGEPFDVVVKRAQDLGYAEADPSFDLDGVDAAHKLTLLVAMAFGADLTYKEIATEGIRGLTPVDFAAAAEFGYRIKLLGIAKAHRGSDGEESIEARVHPTLIPKSSLLASVDGAMNAVAVCGDAVGPTLFYGAGAGELPTASAVVGDLIEVARDVRRGVAGRVAPLSFLPDELHSRPILPLGEIVGRAYLRFSALDRPGALAHITGILGNHEIGIESVSQTGQGGDGESVPVLMQTDPVRESTLREALEEIERLSDLSAPTRLIRIEEEM